MSTATAIAIAATTPPAPAPAMNLETLQQATAYVWQEADMLDHGEYAAWLDLWTDDGTYVVPIDPRETDFENTLNVAYDNRSMRAKRVERLLGGESISATAIAFTVRNISRVRVLADSDGHVTLRCAQDLHEFRKGIKRQHTADVSYTLRRDGDSFRIAQKVVRMINSTDALSTVGFIF